MPEIEKPDARQIPRRHLDLVDRMHGLRPVLKPPVTRRAVLHAQWLHQAGRKRLQHILARRPLDDRTENVEIPVVVEPVRSRRMAASVRPAVRRIVDRRQVDARARAQQIHDRRLALTRRQRRHVVNIEIGKRLLRIDPPFGDQHAVEHIDQALAHRCDARLEGDIAPAIDETPVPDDHECAAFALRQFSGEHVQPLARPAEDLRRPLVPIREGKGDRSLRKDTVRLPHLSSESGDIRSIA